MGASSSRVEDDKALLLCRERKRFVRQAIDGRCELAAAHVSYIYSLRNTATALRKFVETEAPLGSSSPEPLDNSTSQLTNSFPSTPNNAETGSSFSPSHSPPYSARFQVNHMKVIRNSTTSIEEKPHFQVTKALQTFVTTPKRSPLHPDDNLSAETPSPHRGNLPWDYFGLSHGLHNDEEEDVIELGQGGEHASTNERDDSVDFDQPSTEPLVQIFKNRHEVSDHKLVDASPLYSSVQNVIETDQQNGENERVGNSMYEADNAPKLSESTPSRATLPVNEKEKDPGHRDRFLLNDFFLHIKEIENLFLKACESGREVPRMLEAKQSHFRPLFREEIEPASNDIKYLAWHTSVLSDSSSSRNHVDVASREDTGGLGSNIFSNTCMNSGSHASTLDRLYAWERKLYDEVKASGIIRREYDNKCKLLRQQDSKGENPYKIDKTRSTVKDLHTRIRVSIQRIDWISKRIEELRDKELQPQLVELIGGLARMWGLMLACHKSQCNIISAASSIGSTRSSVWSESQRQTTVLFEAELNSLCSSFTRWISAHRIYLQAINGWLLKCVFPLRHKSSGKRKVEFSPRRDIAPPIFVTCRDWLKLLDELPTEDVADAINDLVVITYQFLPGEDKARRASSLPFRFTWPPNEIGDVHRNVAPVDWSLNYGNLQSGLVVFLDQLKSFSESSVVKYEALCSSIGVARLAYQNAALRK